MVEIALKEKKVSADLGLPVDLIFLGNPREELESHHYNPDRQHLLDMGYNPIHDIDHYIRLAYRIVLDGLLLNRSACLTQLWQINNKQ